MTIEVPFIKEKELQKRFQDWLTHKGNDYTLPRSINAEFFVVIANDAQDAFWIGCNYVALCEKLFDGPLTRTL